MVERGRGPRGTHVPPPFDDAGDDDVPDVEAGIVIRDLRTDERYWAHDTLIDNYGPLLGVDGFAIYSSLCLMANRSQYCWPSLTRMARHWGKGKSTVSRAVTLMADLRLVYVKRTTHDDGATGNNIYYLLEPLPIATAVGHLFAALGQRGGAGDAPAGAEEVAARIVHLIPETWEPLRPRKAALKTRRDWEELVRSFVPRSLTGLPRPWCGTGSSDVERENSCENGAGPSMERGGLTPGMGQSLRGEGVVPRQDSKVTPVPGTTENQSQETHHPQPGGGAEHLLLTTEEDIRQYPLADTEVLLDVGEGRAQVVSLQALVCDDIRATRDSYVPVWTDAYYSVAHFLDEEGQEWTPDEERKIARHNELRAELDAIYKSIGACSLEEALARYFTEDLVRRYASDDARERERVQGWLRYVHDDAGASLTSPAGFLRTRLESAQWAPRGSPLTTGAPARRQGP